MTKHKKAHCWHSDNIVLTSNPPQHPETCCNCGAKRRKSRRPVYESGHGPFGTPVVKETRMFTFYQDELGEKPCEGPPK